MIAQIPAILRPIRPAPRTRFTAYDARGLAGLVGARHTNPGGASLLSLPQRAALDTALDGPSPNGGLWSGRKVAAWITAETGKPVSPQRGWEYRDC
jgi:hypothetical protein